MDFSNLAFLLVGRHTLVRRGGIRGGGRGAGPDWISMIPSFISAIGQSLAVKSVAHAWIWALVSVTLPFTTLFLIYGRLFELDIALWETYSVLHMR